MLEDLFSQSNRSMSYSPQTGIPLPPDVDDWPTEIQNIIFSQIPELVGVPGRLNFDASDLDKLYAKGTYEVSTASGEPIIFPILIKSGKILPIDICIFAGKWGRPESDLIASLLTDPSVGTDLLDDKDMPLMSYDDMSAGVNPPDHINSRGLPYIVSKAASLNPQINESIYNAISGDIPIVNILKSRPSMLRKISKLVDSKPIVEKTASIREDAVIIRHGSEFTVKTASSEQTVNIYELMRMVKQAGLDSSRIYNQLKNENIAFTWEDRGSPTPTAVVKEGRYSSVDDEANVIGINVVGTMKVAGVTNWLSINEDGTFSMQPEIAGVRLSDTLVEKTAAAVTVAPEIGDIITVPLGMNEDTLAHTPYIKVASISTFVNVGGQDILKLQGEGPTGAKVAYLVLDAPSLINPIRTFNPPEQCMMSKNAEAWYVPEHLPIIKLGRRQKTLSSSLGDAVDYSMLKRGSSAFTQVAIWESAPGQYAVKVAGKVDLMTPAETMLFLRKHDGGNVGDTMAKLAAGMVKTISMGAEKLDDDLLHSKPTKAAGKISKIDPLTSIKVAAAAEDEETIDAVLSLNYITPQNVAEFSAAIPEMKRAEEALVKMLMAARLGYKAVDESEIKRTLESLHSVIQAMTAVV